VSADSVRFAHDRVRVGEAVLPFEEIIAKAYLARVQLWSDGFYATPKLYWDQSKLQGRPVLLLLVWRRGFGSRDRHADRRNARAARRCAA